jgi:hypothetical protein
MSYALFWGQKSLPEILIQQYPAPPPPKVKIVLECYIFTEGLCYKQLMSIVFSDFAFDCTVELMLAINLPLWFPLRTDFTLLSSLQSSRPIFITEFSNLT